MRELITTDEPTVITKLPFDPIVMEDGQDDGRLPIPPAPIRAIGEAFREMNNFLDKFVASKEDPW